ncbi:MAG TPA: hypothetical protein VHG72_13160 [Polyangia bacterium]|nr:hypothetical protein [Polyangia bacterium]
MARTLLGAFLGAIILGAGCSALDRSNNPPPAHSFTAVYTQIIRPTCSNDFCHYNGVGIRYSALDMSSQVYAYWGLVGQPCSGPSCSEMGTRVIPGQPQNSILYLKVSETMPPCGSQMPADPVALTASGTSVFSGNALPDDQQQLIYDWIEEGAQND